MPTARKLADAGLLVLVNALWAAQYAAYKTAGSALGPVTVNAWVFLLATLVLLPFLILERRRSTRARRPAWSRQNAVGFVMVGVLGLIPASALLAWGTTMSTASNAALIFLTVPIITALLAYPILGERMTGLRWASLVLSLAGVLMLSEIDWRHLELVRADVLLGNLLVLAACAGSAFYNVCSKELLRRFTPLEVLVYSYLLALMVSVPFLIWMEPFSFELIRTYSAGTWLSLAVLSVFCWGLAMVLWFFLLRRLDVSQASVSVYLLPFFGVLISALTLREALTVRMVAGGAITLLGTVLVTTFDRGRKAPGA